MRRRSATLTTKQPTNVERRPSRLNAAKVVGMLTCPSCGSDSFARMSHTWCLHFHECKHCGSMITPRRGECCVFRSYRRVGDLPLRSARPRAASSEALDGRTPTTVTSDRGEQKRPVRELTDAISQWTTVTWTTVTAMAMARHSVRPSRSVRSWRFQLPGTYDPPHQAWSGSPPSDQSCHRTGRGSCPIR